MIRTLLRRLRAEPVHDCWPPRGVVFDATWTCPHCGAQWQLVEHATYSEWVRA